MINAARFREIIRNIVQQETKPLTKLGKVPEDYTEGKPSVLFDGESAPSSKQYPYMSYYTPAPGDRVLLIRAGNSWVIQGKIIY